MKFYAHFARGQTAEPGAPKGHLVKSWRFAERLVDHRVPDLPTRGRHPGHSERFARCARQCLNSLAWMHAVARSIKKRLRVLLRLSPFWGTGSPSMVRVAAARSTVSPSIAIS
jgi:hypothetical protein